MIRMLVTGVLTVSYLASPLLVAEQMPKHSTHSKIDCNALKTELNSRLPKQLMRKLKVHSATIKNPQNTTQSIKACQLNLKTNGSVLQQYKLNTNFIETTLTAMGWQTPADLRAFTADSPTDHQLMMARNQWRTVIRYQFAPPSHLHCPNDKPIAACGSIQQWQYNLELNWYPI